MLKDCKRIRYDFYEGTFQRLLSIAISLQLIVLFLSFEVSAQTFYVNLSPKHEQKMSLIKSGHKRMMKYYKYYKKDSTAHRKKLDKAARHQLDSSLDAEAKGNKLKSELSRRGLKGEEQWLYSDSIVSELKTLDAVIRDSTSTDSAKVAARKRRKVIAADKVNRELARGTLPGTRPYRMTDDTRKELQHWWAVMKDSTQSDSARNVAREKVKAIALEHALKNPQFKGMYEQYKQYGKKPDWTMLNAQVPGMDSLQGVFDSSPDKLMNMAEGVVTQAASKAAALGSFSKEAAQLDETKKLVRDLSRPDDLKAKGQEQLKQQGIDHFAGQEQKLQAAQARISKLMGKYKSFTDVNDLSTAVKKNSLEGKTFKERLVLGGNFNVVSTAPLSLDLAPLVGYRINAKVYFGLSANYRYTFKDSLRYKWYVSPSNTSFRLFGNYDLIKNFFAYGEVERAGVKVQPNDAAAGKWRTNYFVGLGRKILIMPKLYMTVTALYNLNNEQNNPSYPRRFQVRLGFQTSDLAFRKKQIYYNP